MPLNQQFAIALRSPEVQHKSPEACRQALDALVAAGEDISAYRQAILAHKSFWEGVAGLSLDGVGDNDAFLNPADAVGTPILRYHARLARARTGLAENAAVAERIATCDPGALMALLQNDDAVKAVVGTWDATTHVQTCNLLQQFAQSTLLLAKVREATPEQVDALLYAQTPADFNAAAQALGYAGDHCAASSECLRDLYAYYFTTRLGKADIETLGNVLLNNPNFRDGLAGSGLNAAQIRALDLVDAEYLRQQLGIRYLGQARMDDTLLTQLAACENATAFRAVLRTSVYGEMPLVVTDTTFASLREQAAMRLLGRTLANCRETAALNALRGATTAEEIRGVLEAYPSLGFAGDGNRRVREAIATHRAVPELARRLNPALAARKIQDADFNTPEGKALLEGILQAPGADDVARALGMEGASLSPRVKARALSRALENFLEQAPESTVKELVTYDDPARGPDAYADLLRDRVFAGNANPQLQAFLREHCKTPPANETALRQKAASAYLWHHADRISDDALDAFAANEDDDDIETACNEVFPGAPEGVTDALEFSRYAIAQQCVRAARADDKAALMRFANHLNVGDADNNAALDALDPDKKTALRAQVAGIMLQKEPFSRDLEVLANARNKEARTRALKALHLADTVVDAFTDAQLARLQTQARERLNDLRIEGVSRFGAKARPSLLALISRVPDDDARAALLDDKKAMRALINARFPQDVTQAYPAFAGANAEINALCAENKRLEMIGKVHNAPLARVLADLQVTLTPAGRDQINHILATPLADAAALDAIGVALHGACGLSGTPDALRRALAGVSAEVIAQQRYNNAGAMLYQGPPLLPDLDKRILDFFLGLPKTEDFDAPALWAANTGLLDVIKQAKTLGDLHAAIEAAPWKGVLPPDWKENLTPARFRDFKMLQRRAALSGPGFNAEMAELQQTLGVMRTRQDDFAASGKALKYFDRFHPAYAFMPVFQGKSRENARVMKGHFVQLDADCETIITNLRGQLETLQNIGGSLPDPTGMSQSRVQALQDLNQNLQAQERRVRELLAFYERMQLALRGDPHGRDAVLRKGVMAQIDELESGKRTTMVFANCVEADYPDTAGAVENLARAAPGALPLVTMSANGGPFDFGEAKPLADGMLREYTLSSVANPGLQGRYAEQRSSAGVMPGSGASVDHVTLTVTQFPKPSAGVTPEELHEARVEFAMTMASQMLASIDWTPSEKRPLFIKGSDAEQQKYLWTALRILGENTPGKKFDEKAIKVFGPFKPSSEMGFFSHFSSTKRKFEKVMQPEDVERMEKFDAKQRLATSPERQKDIKKALEEFTGRGEAAIQDAKDENTKNSPAAGA